MENNGEEPSTAPEPGQWYNIKLGPSFKDNHNHSDHSPKLCTLRYEFKPASIDSSQPGLLHKSKDNRVTVEFQNNQQGKPKVIFEGIEDYRDNDAVLFFDGETFRLERLHRAVNCLRHVRLPGEPAATAASTMTTSVVPLVESYTTPVGKGSKLQSSNIGVVHEALPQVEHIDIGNSTTVGPSAEPESEKDVEFPPSLPNPLTSSPDEPEENVDIVDGDDYGCQTEKGGNASEMEARTGLDVDINLPHQMDIDVEIADVDISDNEADKGPNAAEALRAQVNAEGREGQSSSSSSSSDSESTGTESGSGSGSGSGSESGSVSTSTDTASSDGDSVNSV